MFDTNPSDLLATLTDLYRLANALRSLAPTIKPLLQRLRTAPSNRPRHRRATRYCRTHGLRGHQRPGDNRP